jgi:hypothetical protein
MTNITPDQENAFYGQRTRSGFAAGDQHHVLRPPGLSGPGPADCPGSATTAHPGRRHDWAIRGLPGSELALTYEVQR